jgi:general stress protein 26
MGELLKEKIFKILSQRQLSSVATVDCDGKPQVRYVMTEGDDELIIRFATLRQSRKIGHIRNNKHVSVCSGLHAPVKTGAFLQITGEAEIRDDESEKNSFWKDNLCRFFSGKDDPNYVIVYIKPKRIEYWTNKLEPEVWTLG